MTQFQLFTKTWALWLRHFLTIGFPTSYRELDMFIYYLSTYYCSRDMKSKSRITIHWCIIMKTGKNMSFCFRAYHFEKKNQLKIDYHIRLYTKLSQRSTVMDPKFQVADNWVNKSKTRFAAYQASLDVTCTKTNLLKGSRRDLLPSCLDMSLWCEIKRKQFHSVYDLINKI